MATRTVLGLSMDEDFDVHKAGVGPRRPLAFYTDGVSEAANGRARSLARSCWRRC